MTERIQFMRKPDFRHVMLWGFLMGAVLISKPENITPIVGWKIADATSQACAADCSRRAETCKQACPTTFGVACQTSCDSQAQTCRQACQPR